MIRKLLLIPLLAFCGINAYALDNGRYNIISSLSGMYLDVSGRSSDDGANIIQYSRTGGTNQQFDVTQRADGSYTIQPVHSGKSLDVYDWNSDDGAELRQWSFLNNVNQHWYIDNVGNGLHAITSKFSGKAIDVWEMKLDAGADIRLYTYWGGAGQKWRFVPVASSPNNAPVDVFIAGDSTVMTYTNTASPNDQAGWGQMIPALYNTAATFHNHAIGGRTARRFIDEGRLDRIWSQINAGDYLLVQFGTNDAHRTATYTINGQTIPYYLDPNTDFKYYLSRYIDGARQRSVNLIFVTPPPRNSAYCTGGNGMAAHAQAMRELAAERGIPLADLNAKTVNYLRAICPAPTPENFFLIRADGSVDGTHFQENGARILSRLVADGIAEAGSPLNSYRR